VAQCGQGFDELVGNGLGRWAGLRQAKLAVAGIAFEPGHHPAIGTRGVGRQGV